MNSNVGNEHFKCWLRNLNPSSRMQKMSAICKTQASKGLRGSLIKTSLAQLSQKCQVMMIRLTETEIKHYTRRRPVKRICTPEEHKNPINIKIKKPKQTNKSILHRVDSKSKLPQILDTVGPSIHNNKEESSITNYKQSSNSSADSSGNITLGPKVSKSRKKKYQELFGDDLEDLTESVNGSNDLRDANSNVGEKNVKNYFSTVNVNIYNSASVSPNEKAEVIVKSKSNTEENKYSKKSSHKRLKYGVNVPNDITSFYKENIAFLSQQEKKLNKIIAATKQSKKAKRKAKSSTHKSSETHKHKNKPHFDSNNLKLSSIVNTDQYVQESSIQQLWSILGMESPTDRSENIIKSHPLNTTNENNNISLPSSTNVDIHLVESNNQEVNDSSRHAIACQVDSEVTNVSEGNYNRCDDPLNSLSNNTTVSLELEPVCKIANTFSLANIIPVEESDLCKKTATRSSKNKDNGFDISILLDKETNNDGYQHRTLETVCIDTDSIIGDDVATPCDDTIFTTNLNTEEHSKVGTIRVKNLGLLLNPELVPQLHTPENEATENSCKDNNKKATDTNDTVQCTLSNNAEQEVKKRFLLTYKYYFDSFVESVIPILGDVLHLAIADLIRKEERIKRAKQLSSDDLISDENQRAEKEFNDMMKTRGNEFSSLFSNILKKFEEMSKITLFISLFCRLLNHAEQIDPANKNYIVKARDVISAMLSKHEFRDEEITELLIIDPEQFQAQVDMINELIVNCTNTNESLTESIPSKTVVQQDTRAPTPRVRVISASPAIGPRIKKSNPIPNKTKNASLSFVSNPITAISRNEKPIKGSMPGNVNGIKKLIEKNHISQTSQLQISNRNQSALSVANSLPDITITKKQHEQPMTNCNQLGQMNISNSLQSSGHNKIHLNGISQSISHPNILASQYPQSSTNQKQVINIPSQASIENKTNVNKVAISSSTGLNAGTGVVPQYNHCSSNIQVAPNSIQLSVPNTINVNKIVSSNTGSKSTPQYVPSSTNLPVLPSHSLQSSVQNMTNVSVIPRRNSGSNSVPQYIQSSTNLQAVNKSIQSSAQNATNVSIIPNRNGASNSVPHYIQSLTKLQNVNKSLQSSVQNKTNISIIPRSNSGSNSEITEYSQSSDNLQAVNSLFQSTEQQKKSDSVTSAKNSGSNNVPQYTSQSNLIGVLQSNLLYLLTKNPPLNSQPSSTNEAFTKSPSKAPISQVPGMEFDRMNQSFNRMHNSIGDCDVNNYSLATERRQPHSVPNTSTDTVYLPETSGTPGIGIRKDQHQQYNPDDPTITLNNLLVSSTQVPIPSSSHCHPFVNRMPISGKLKMLFDTNS